MQHSQQQHVLFLTAGTICMMVPVDIDAHALAGCSQHQLAPTSLQFISQMITCTWKDTRVWIVKQAGVLHICRPKQLGSFVFHIASSLVIVCFNFAAWHKAVAIIGPIQLVSSRKRNQLIDECMAGAINQQKCHVCVLVMYWSFSSQMQATWRGKLLQNIRGQQMVLFGFAHTLMFQQISRGNFTRFRLVQRGAQCT